MMFKIAISSIIAVASADKASIDRQLQAYIQNSSLRAFSGNIANAVNSLDEYGCWCYFYDNVGRGKGQPVDEIDGFCKTLADGYTCAIIDQELEGESCVPWEVDYNPGTGAGVNLLASCNSLNDNNCARYACTVEGQFVDNLFAFLLSGSQIDYNTYGHSNGFDPGHNEGCPVKGCYQPPEGNLPYNPGAFGLDVGPVITYRCNNYSAREKRCCGAYPFRFPFVTLEGERACCGSRTYNTNLLNCCAGAQVKANC